MTNFIDLTHTFTDNMPVYPGDPCSRLYQSAHLDKDGFNDCKLETTLHVGTHMDAPLHMINGAPVISDFPLDKFKARGVLIDATGQKEIDASVLDGHDIQAGDAVLFFTGWDQHFDTEHYYQDWPILTEDLAKILAKKKISLVGLDTPSPDADEPFPVHKVLLAEEILIVENMTNLSALKNHTDFIVYAYPAKFKADAAPVRIFAEV